MTFPAPSATARWPWLAVGSIAVSSFSIVTAEFVPVGLLATIAREFDVTIGSAGFLVAMPALVAAIAAPSLTLYAAQRDRRSILLALSILLAVSNLVSAVATSWLVLLLARFLLGIAVGGFWAIGASLAGRLVPADSSGRATSIVYAGVSIGIVLGVPVGTAIGQAFDWRMAFAASGIVALIAVAAQWVLLPSLRFDAALRPRDMLSVALRPGVRIVLLVTLVAIGAQYATYTFIEPYLGQVTELSGGYVTLALLLFGGAGVAGSVLGGIGADRSIRLTLMVVLATIAVALAGLFAFGDRTWAAMVIMIIWGVAFGALPLCLQLWTMREAEPAIEAGSELFVSILQVAIALGAAIGGVIVNLSGLASTMGIGALLFVVTCALVARAGRQDQPRPAATA